jgi:nucleotide-binding universal stress UspA family protein
MTSGTYTRVLVGTDGSPSAQCAVHAAGAVARALGVPIVVATGWYRDKLVDVPSQEAAGASTPTARSANWATDTAVDAAAALRATGLDDVRTAEPEGAPADGLIRLADDHPGTLLVVGTRGLDSTTDRLLGNIPHQLTHHARSDLLLISRPDCSPDTSWSRVALATDGSPTAELAVQHGLAIARALGAHTTLLTVAADEARGDRVLTASGADTEDVRVAIGRDITDTLTDAARDYDLLVLGNKGMSGPSRLLGSVANSVTHHLPTDLLLVNTSR